ncbi:MAG: hypothetical protein QOF77_1464 [Solirubrobacteraceae bacterium]|nr:hypothetical protein [Solirubrobacteraceae bacterium]
MFDRLDDDARRAVMRAAQEEAREQGSATIEAEHLLLALAAEEDTPTGRLLAAAGLDHEGVLAALASETARSLAAVGVAIDDFASFDAGPTGRPSPKLAASAKRVLERAVGLARAGAAGHITSAHLLAGILGAAVGTVPRALETAGIDRIALGAGAERLLGPR